MGFGEVNVVVSGFPLESCCWGRGEKILRVAMLITQALAGPGGGFLLPFSVDLPTESLTQEY